MSKIGRHGAKNRKDHPPQPSTMTRYIRRIVQVTRWAVLLLLSLSLSKNPSQSSSCLAFSMSMSSSRPTTGLVDKGSAAKPYEKQNVAVFGAGGYLGGCIYGFLQRAGSLYGTGIAGVGGGPRAVVATSSGSVSLNSVLSNHFILAQADESFVKLTDMTSLEAVQSRLKDFDAAIVPTRFSLEPRPVTLGSYEKTPNDKTMEFFMERPRMVTAKVMDDPTYSQQLFNTILQASKTEGLRHLVVLETDSEFDTDRVAGDKYLQLLEEAGVPYTYIRPLGSFENSKGYTYAKGIQSSLKITRANSLEEFKSASGTIFREDVAAVCVQALLSLDWSDNRVLQVEKIGTLDKEVDSKAIPQREWCMNSDTVQSLLTSIA